MRRRRPPAALAGIALVWLAAAPLLAADRLKSGMWEYVMTSNGASHTSKHCVGGDEAAGVNGDTRSGRAWAEKRAAAEGGGCTVKAFQIDGNVVTYTLLCGNREIRSTSTYSGDTSDTTLVAKFDGKETTTRVKARRLGSCP